MLIYSALFLLPVIGHILSPEIPSRLSRIAWVGLVAFTVLIVGLRFDVGCDWKGYWIIYEVINGQNTGSFYHNYINPSSVTRILKEGALYLGLNWLVGQFNAGLVGVNLICALVMLLGLSAFCRRLPLPWLGWLIASPYLITVVGMGYTRQSVAIGLFCWALGSLRDSKIGKYLLFCFFAAGFHISAILLIFLGLIFYRRRYIQALTTFPRLSIALSSGAALILGLVLWVALGDDLIRYLTSPHYHSSGASYRALLTAVPGVFLLLLRDKIYQPNSIIHQFFLVLALVGIAFFPLSFFATTLIDRLGLYLIVLQIYFWPIWLARIDAGKTAATCTIGLVFVYGGIFFGWLKFSDNSHCWVTYQNYLFI